MLDFGICLLLLLSIQFGGFSVQTLVSNSVVKDPLTCSTAWSRGWKTPPTPFYTQHTSTYRFRKATGPYCSWVSSKGASSSKEGFDPADQESLWSFLHLGFTCRASTIILRFFPESYHHWIFSFRLGRLGGKRTSCDSVFLRSREIYLEFGSETSHTGFP